MTGRGMLFLLLAVVAGAAAMLSFAALRDLAELCGFAHGLAWLLPVVIDAGAAAGSLVWLGPASGAAARRFARRLALGLLGLSVAANALGHGLAAYKQAPPWWVVVVLSGIAPAVLGAMVHLAVLVGRPEPDTDDEPVEVDALPSGAAAPMGGDSIRAGFPWTWNPAPPAAESFTGKPAAVEPVVDGLSDAGQKSGPAPSGPAVPRASADARARLADLLAAGAGRRRISRELGVTEYEARRLVEQARPATSPEAALDAVAAPSLAPSGAQS